MFRLVYDNKVVGVSLFESGDPSIGCASGKLREAGNVHELSKWIIAQGGAEQEGAFLLEIDSTFLVLIGENTPVPFSEGSIICVSEDYEMYLEITGVPGPEYKHFFPQLVESFELNEQQPDATGE